MGLSIGGALHALLQPVMNVAHAVEGGHAGGPIAAAAPAAGQALQAAGHPDLTYNPNPATNIPNSSHNLAVVQLLNGRLPMNQANLGTRTQDPTNAGRPMTGNFNPQQSPANQFNPGYIPLQNSGFGGPGYTANLQPANLNPQQSIFY